MVTVTPGLAVLYNTIPTCTSYDDGGDGEDFYLFVLPGYENDENERDYVDIGRYYCHLDLEKKSLDNDEDNDDNETY